MIPKGRQISISVFRDRRTESSSTAPLSSYMFVLEDVDALVKFLFHKANVNPQFYLQRLSENAKDFISRDNVHRLE
jgi:hypothetical protein